MQNKEIKKNYQKNKMKLMKKYRNMNKNLKNQWTNLLQIQNPKDQHGKNTKMGKEKLNKKFAKI